MILLLLLLIGWLGSEFVLWVDLSVPFAVANCGLVVP